MFVPLMEKSQFSRKVQRIQITGAQKSRRSFVVKTRFTMGASHQLQVSVALVKTSVTINSRLKRNGSERGLIAINKLCEIRFLRVLLRVDKAV